MTTEKQQADLWLEIFKKITELGMNQDSSLSDWLLGNITIERNAGASGL